MKKSILLLSATTLLVNYSNAAVIAVGDVIGIDIGAVAPVGASTFNDYGLPTLAAGSTGPTLGSLVTTSGAAVDNVTFVLQNATTKTNLNPFGVPFATAPAAPFNDVSVHGDAFIVNNTGAAPLSQANSNVILTFSNLDDSLTYDLAGGYKHTNQNTIFNTTWSADGQSATTNAGAAGDGFTSLSGLSTDGSGNLVITLDNSGGNAHVVVSSLTLTAVPEPSAFALLGLGLVGLLTRRRRN